MALQLLTERKIDLIVRNVVKACKDIDKLNGTGYGYINLASGFIAHYNIHGFKDYHSDGSLAERILAQQAQNQYDNFRPGEMNYEYYRQKAVIYNRICKAIRTEVSNVH